ncbi:class I SAM-dependent methyltransferase [Kordiimonas gwangyangensis]|uniref:class I SAM-dependent methyltransferase n=1 Tax=Kordiimonas gwangyangensis TaxID=288022 RepID=UPI0009DB24C2|nr:class I SAM-dependent methyltransferase [Kordiimonas gwangyangensis]
MLKYKKYPVAKSIGNRWLYPPIFDPDYLHRKTLLAVIRRLSTRLSSNSRILDVGCGWMPYRSLFKAQVYEGVDVLPHGDTSIALIGDDRKIPKPDAVFDVCVSWQVLEHVDSLHLFHAEIRRCLKPGGRLYLTTHGFFRVHAEADFWRWTKQGLERHFEQYGWSDVSVEPIDNAIVSATGFCNALVERILLPEDRNKAGKVKKIVFAAYALLANCIGLILLRSLPASKIAVLESDSSTFLISCTK